MSPIVKPLAAEVEEAIRERLKNNPFVNFMGIEVPQLASGLARFRLEVRRDFLNSQGFLQGGVIAAWPTKPWPTPSSAWCPRAR